MKNVLITGATGGIGQSLVKLFYSKDYTICATGTNSEKLKSLEENFPERLKCIRCDLSDHSQIEDLVQKANKFYGGTNISLPVYPKLKLHEVNTICKTIINLL